MASEQEHYACWSVESWAGIHWLNLSVLVPTERVVKGLLWRNWLRNRIRGGNNDKKGSIQKKR